MTSNDLFEAIRAYNNSGEPVSKWEKAIWERFGCRRAVLVLDSTGFTRVTHSHGIVHYLSLVTQLRDMIQHAFQEHGSIYFHAAADNIYAHFKTPEDALDAAIAANAALYKSKLMVTETEPFTVCIGVGFGDVLNSATEGVYGSERNLASKLGEDVAEGREILLTHAAWDNLAPEKKKLFEERHYGIADESLRYFWMHWRG